jgi:hypothetical protein
MFAIFGTTFLVVSDVKDRELSEIKAQYQEEISELNQDIIGLTMERSSLTLQLMTMNETLEKWRFVGYWTGTDMNESYETTWQYEFYANGSFEAYASGESSGGSWHTEYNGTYDLEGKNKVALTPYGWDLSWRIYDYSFSEDFMALTLNNVNLTRGQGYIMED